MTAATTYPARCSAARPLAAIPAGHPAREDERHDDQRAPDHHAQAERLAQQHQAKRRADDRLQEQRRRPGPRADDPQPAEPEQVCADRDGDGEVEHAREHGRAEPGQSTGSGLAGQERQPDQQAAGVGERQRGQRPVPAGQPGPATL